MKYECPRCGYKTNKICDIKRHIKRKKICVGKTDVIPTLDNIIIQKKVSQNVDDDEKQQLKKEIQELKEKLNETAKTVVNIGSLNINLNNYRDTTYDHLTEKHFKYAIQRMLFSVPQLIKDVHFNPEVPENHNIYISNIKGKYAMVYCDGKWCAQNQNQVINKLINDQEYAIEEWLGEGDNYPNEMKKFKEYLEMKEEDAKKNMIKEEVKLILYNNRNTPKNTNTLGLI
jgi:hypothetical protein